MKLLLDEMMPHAVAVQLRARGHEVQTVDDHGLRGKSDLAIWTAAQAEGLTLVTEDTDYRVFVQQFARPGEAHSGIVFTSTRRLQRGDPRTVGRLVTALDGLL